MAMTVVVCNPADAELVNRVLRAAGTDAVVSAREVVRPGEVHGIVGSMEKLAPVLRGLR